MSHLRRLAAMILAALVAVALAAAPAAAGKQTTKDQSRDVYKVPFGAGAPHLVRTDRTHDITRAGATYNGPRLVVWLQVRRLAGADYVAHFDVRTPGDRWQLYYDTNFTPAYTSLFHGLQEVLDCGGLNGKKVPRQDRIVISVPRACIGSPRWIRFGAVMYHENNTYAWIDDARLDAGFYSNKCQPGPRLRHN